MNTLEAIKTLHEALTMLRNECELSGLRERAGFDCWLNVADEVLAATASKTRYLEAQGMKPVGVVMLADDGKRATVDMGRVTWTGQNQERVALSDAQFDAAEGAMMGYWMGDGTFKDAFTAAILVAQADAGIPASNTTPPHRDEPSASVCACCGSHPPITQPLIAEAALDDVMDRCNEIDSTFTHRLAIMLECMLIDPNGSWNESALLLDEYRAAWDAINPPPPTFMGEPMPPDRKLRLMLELERRAAIAASKGPQ